MHQQSAAKIPHKGFLRSISRRENRIRPAMDESPSFTNAAHPGRLPCDDRGRCLAMKATTHIMWPSCRHAG
jgi:hypothetical protein